MKVYAVGGSVRDEILGMKPHDHDYVVVGSTEQEMLDKGFKRVGESFPVFLHPDTGEEYALARRERKVGVGHTGFEVEFDPSVTLVEDLQRRDFTMNAIAKNLTTGEYYDPYNGIQHAKEMRIELVNPTTFLEDPLRYLRACRFTTRGFSMPLLGVKQMPDIEEIKSLSGERVRMELEKALMSYRPSKFFTNMNTRYLRLLFPQIYEMKGVSHSPRYHQEGDVFEHTMMVLDCAAASEESLAVRYACLTHDFGKAQTPKDLWPKHHGHEGTGKESVLEFCKQLKVPNKYRDLMVMAEELHMKVHKYEEMSNQGKLRFFKKLFTQDDATFEERLYCLEAVGIHDSNGRLPRNYKTVSDDFFRDMMALSSVKLSKFKTPEEIANMTIEHRKNFIDQERHRVLAKIEREKIYGNCVF